MVAEQMTSVATDRRMEAYLAFWAKNKKGFTFLPKETREWIIDTGTTFVIRSIRDGASKFGATWYTTIELELPDHPNAGSLWTVPMSHNAVRDQIMLNMAEFLNSDEGRIGLPSTLVSFDTDLGPGYDFAPPPDFFPELGDGEELGLNEPGF